jgi:hypothetical protein
MNSINPAIAELERAYRELKALFPGGIPGGDPVIVIQGARSSSLLSMLTPHAWENRDGQEVNEISIAAEHLARPIEDIIAALLHEMVHHYNALRGIADGGGPRGYHNQAFRDLAQAVGLIAERDGHDGWAATRLGPKAQAAVRRLNAEEQAFEIFRKNPRPSRQPTRMLKWSCGCTTVRCATDLRAVCQECGQQFEQE